MNVRVGWLLAAVLLVGACRSDDGGAEATSTTASSAVSSTTSSPTAETGSSEPTFTGDPGSAFCRSLDELGPVADPFQPGLEPREVQLRLRALRLRTEDALAVAPPELSDDIASLVAALRDLDESLEEHDYDFSAAAEAGVDLSFANDAAFADAAVRIGAYREQVCA